MTDNPADHSAREIADLTRRLREAEDTLEAIRTGQVDALFVEAGEGMTVYTLESADRPYRTLIEQMQEGAFSMTPDGMVLYGNPRLSEIVQRPLESVLGHQFSAFVQPGERPRFEEFLHSSLSTPMRGEFGLELAEGVVVPVYLSLRALDEDALGNTIICGVLTDLTQQRLMEARLTQTQKMEAVGQLTGGLAHDFNNLLQGIKGSLDLIIHRSDAPKIVKWAQAGLKAADRGAKLTAQLLAFSRSQKIELKPLRVDAVISEMTELLQRTLGTHVVVQIDLDAADHFVMSDATQIELAILNLALNARDALDGQGTVTLQTRFEPISELSEHGALRIGVLDNGCGMSEQVLADARLPFFTTKGIGAGTGLGLAQVQSIMEQSGGLLDLHSQPGQGTQVYLTLPCTPAVPASVGSLPSPLQEQTSRRQVLVIDDDNEVRRVIVEMLGALQHQTCEADNGLDGLAQLTRLQPDVVLLDFAMPGLNGAQIARLIRERYPQLPIVFISGYSETGLLEEALGGTALVLRKPFTMAQLNEVVCTPALIEPGR